MKKILSLFVAAVLCFVCCFGVYAEAPQPRWKELTYMAVDLIPYNGIYNNAKIQASAHVSTHSDTVNMTVTITKWDGNSYVDTDTSWSLSRNGVTDLSKTFRLGQGNYVARVTVSVYDASGTFIESETIYSQELII